MAYERFTDRARRTLVEAQQEAAAARQFIRGDHFLIALANADDGVAVSALREFGVDGDAARAAAVRLQPPGPPVSTDHALSSIGIDVEKVKQSVAASLGDVPVNVPNDERPAFAVDGKQILEQSLRESVRLESGFIGTEHLLLGLLATPKSVGLDVLRDLSVDLDALQTRVLEMMGARLV